MNEALEFDQSGLKLKPIINYPRQAQVGQTYLMTIDVQLEAPGTPWPYAEEEYSISCVLNTQPYFSYEPLKKQPSGIVLHQFGGTYGPVEYLLTASTEVQKLGSISVMFVNQWGIPLATTQLACEVTHESVAATRGEILITRNPVVAENIPVHTNPPQEPLIYQPSIRSSEQDNRHIVEEKLQLAGWTVQTADAIDINNSQGIAIREFALPTGVASYLLVVDGQAVGMVDVWFINRAHDSSEQRHITSSVRFLRSPLPFSYSITGFAITFTNELEPDARSRSVFYFHRPETLAYWLSQAPIGTPNELNGLFRSRLRHMPALSHEDLHPHQYEAIVALEKSFAENHSRALIQMTTGSGKSYMVINSICRLLKYGHARRILFLTDRQALALHVLAQFQQYIMLDDGRKFTELYQVQHLQNTQIDDSTAVVFVATIQDLYSKIGNRPLPNDVLLPDETLFPENSSAEEDQPHQISYHSLLPIEYFDAIFIDDCYRMTYPMWRPLLEYFDAFVIGTTHLVEIDKYLSSFFKNNIVYCYFPAYAPAVVQQLWDYRDVLHDSISYSNYIEQLTYLLFLKMADERSKQSDEKVNIPAGFDWQSLLNKNSKDLESHYSTILQRLGNEPGMLGILFKKALNKIQDPVDLHHLMVDLVDRVFYSFIDISVMGDIYDRLLVKNAENAKSSVGRYITPRYLIQTIVDVMRPELGQTICDPACGTGGFLVTAYNYLTNPDHGVLSRRAARDLKNQTFYGWEIVDRNAQLCVMNLFMHGIGPEDGSCPIIINDSLLSPPEKHFDIILSNLPLRNQRGKNNPAIERPDFILKTSNDQLNFVQHIKMMLKAHGRAAVVVSDDVLYEGGAGEKVRDDLLKTCNVHTLLRLPIGVFFPLKVNGNVLFFDRMPGSDNPWTKDLWVYDFRTDQSFTNRTNLLTRSHFDDFVQCYHAENRNDRCETQNFRKFSYDELIRRENVNLDLIWPSDSTMKFSRWLNNQQSQRAQPFSEEQIRWLELIRDRISSDHSFEEEDFNRSPFSFDGGLIAARHLFGSELPTLLNELNNTLV